MDALLQLACLRIGGNHDCCVLVVVLVLCGSANNDENEKCAHHFLFDLATAISQRIPF